MTSTAPEQVPAPDTDSPRGYYGNPVTSHVKNLLARATATTGNRLTVAVVEKMRRHYQISSCLLVQSLPLISADWSIECEDDAAREALTAMFDQLALTVHRSAARALWAGYSPNTMTWRYSEDLRGTYPVEIRDLEPRTCEARVDDAGTFDGFVQKNVTGKDDADIEWLYALWIVEGMESGNLYGRPIIDAALDPWKDHAAFRAFHARYLERFGEPVVVARAPAGKVVANLAEIEAATARGEEPPAPIIEDALSVAQSTAQELRHHSVVALPSALQYAGDGKSVGFQWTLDYLEANGGSGDDFLNAIRECDKRIARAMFVPDLLATSGDTGGSVANALGVTHRNVWETSVEGRLDDYSRQITAQLIRPAQILNFGPDSPPARLVYAPLADAELDRLWSLVVGLVERGELPVDGRELAEKYDLPLVDEAEEQRRKDEQDEQDAAAAEAAAAAAAEATSTDEPPVDESLSHAGPNGHTAAVSSPTGGWIAGFAVDPVAGLPDWKLPQSYDPPPWHRELNARERRVGFARLERGLNDAEADVIAKLVEVLDGEHDRVLAQIAGILKRGTAAEVLAALGTIEIKAGPKVARAWSDMMRTVSGVALEQIRGELADYAERMPATLGAEGAALFGSYATTAADAAIGRLLTEVRSGLLNAYTSGVTSRPALSSIVGQVFDAYQGGESKPVRLTSRMLSAKSMNYSRAAAIERGGVPLAGAQYSAVLDRRTCELCGDLDEKVIAIEHTDLARFTPPIHHQCRCLWVWITREEADFTPTWSTPAASKVDRFGGLVIG